MREEVEERRGEERRGEERRGEERRGEMYMPIVSKQRVLDMAEVTATSTA